MFKVILTVIFIVRHVHSTMEPFIVGGRFASKSSYPHQLYLEIYGVEPCLCGGSILNQLIILTAAHCLSEFSGAPKSDKVVVKYGSDKTSGHLATTLKAFKIHEKYVFETMYGDIAVGICKTPIRLGKFVKKVALLANPPYRSTAQASGYGAINAALQITDTLKETEQQIQPARICKKLSTPAGAFCAGPLNGPGHPSVGDSGGALVVDQYIQIGIVSYKVDQYTLVAYTNVSFHYPWILRHSARLYCLK